MSNTNEAWEKIFNALKIKEALKTSSFFNITAQQINLLGQREARLMAKFDTKESLPELFKEYQLNINATTNGIYTIFKDLDHRSFIKLPDYKIMQPKRIYPELDFELETLSFNNRMSESNAIDFAHHSKLLSIYLNEDNLKLTTRGRFFSNAFSFDLGSTGRIIVKGVQIEIDAGYEGPNQFLILEAKSSTRNTFNIRQLYYPFKHFQNKIGKKIRTVLLSFSNGIYYFTEFEFNSNYYDTIIINNQAFEVVIGNDSKKISKQELIDQNTYIPEVTAPQADDLNKIIDLVNFLLHNEADKFKISKYFEFEDRQGDYYGNAGRYIGLIEKNGYLYSLTPTGEKLANTTSREERNLLVAKAILNTDLFNTLFRLHLIQGSLTDADIIKILIKTGLNITTANRRKSTIKSWIKWIELNIPN